MMQNQLFMFFSAPTFLRVGGDPTVDNKTYLLTNQMEYAFNQVICHSCILITVYVRGRQTDRQMDGFAITIDLHLIL